MAERLFNTYQIANLLGVTPGTVVDWMRKGTLPFKRLPDGPIRIPESGLVRFLKGQGIDIEEIMAKAVLREDGAGAVTSRSAPRSETQAEPPVARPPAAAPARTEASPRSMIAGLTALLSGRRRAQEAPAEGGDDTGVPQPEELLAEAGPEPAPAETQRPAAEPQEQEGAEPAEEKASEPVTAGEEPRLEARSKVRSGPQGAADEAVGKRAPGKRPVFRARRDPTVSVAELLATELGAEAEAGTRAAELLLADAADSGASHVHIEARADGPVVRLRLGGYLRPGAGIAPGLTAETTPALVRQLKSLAGLEADRSDRPQTAQFSFPAAQGAVRVRLTTCPTTAGENVVVHLLGRPEAAGDLADVGLADEDELVLGSLLAEPRGLIVVAAAPGAPGRALLRGMVGRLAHPGRCVLTAERSAEAEIEGVCRTEVAGAGGAFAEVAEALAAQDADALILGDCPDAATVQAALDAARDALVVARVDARDARGALAILHDAALPAWPMAARLLGVVAQRTCRRLCDECKKALRPTRSMLGRLGLPARPGFTPYRAVGCDACGQSGYTGAAGVLAILRIDDAMASMLRRGAGAEAVCDAAAGAGFRTLRQLVLEKVEAGDLAAEELLTLR